MTVVYEISDRQLDELLTEAYMRGYRDAGEVIRQSADMREAADIKDIKGKLDS